VPPTTTGTITKLLIANRGEIAARVIKTAHALGIATVAVYSDPDADAPYVTLADEAVRLPGAAPADTYLRGDLVIAAAAATGAGAVHPGYGFLSENAAFARACADAGLIFVGPAPETIAAMGDKVAAKAMMADAGVPVLPGMTVTNDGDLAEAATQVGFPLLVKAAFGGGGRGMRLVASPAELTGAVSSARREAASAFGDGTVFLERSSSTPGTSRCRSSATPRAPLSTCSSASAPSSAATRRSSRSARRRPSAHVCAPRWPPRPSPRAGRSATPARAPSSSCWTARVPSTSWR